MRKIETPRHGGYFTEEEAKQRGMRLAIGRHSNTLCLYLLVDESDGVIADARFQVLGESALIGAAEAACELLMRKNVLQARNLSADLIDKQARDNPHQPAFPVEAFSHLNHVLDAIELAVEQCLDIPLVATYVPTPLDTKTETSSGYPGWALLDRERKIAVIEEVIESQIRPYIALDAGGVQIIDLVNDRELTIAYEGACTSCHSATGATLNAIQEILRAQVDPSLVVIPDASFLHI